MKDHYGLEKVKQRIIEYIAVAHLKGDAERTDFMPGRSSGRGENLLGQIRSAGPWTGNSSE